MTDLGYFYRKKTKQRLWAVLILICVISLLLEIPLHRHSHFAEKGLQSIDGMFSFFAILGFFACVLLIVISNALGKILKVKEDYYDRDA